MGATAGHSARPFQPYVGLSVGLHLGAVALAAALGAGRAAPLPEVMTVALIAPPAAAARGPGGTSASIAAPPPPAAKPEPPRAELRPPAPRPKPRPVPEAVSLAPKRVPEPPRAAEPPRAPESAPPTPPVSAPAVAPSGVSSAATGGPGAGGSATVGGSGAGGSASFAPGGAADAVQAYIALVRARIQAERRYSSMARRRGLEGVVTVRLQLDAGGKVAGLDVEDGAPLLLAKATQEAVKRAGPFPPPPDGLGVLRIPVRYRLTD
jgi:protein TonB